MAFAPAKQQRVDALLAEGVGHHTRRDLALAERRYRQVLGEWPDHPDALHLLGVIAHQTGRHAGAITLIRRALRARPGVADYHSNLGDALRADGDLAAAAEAYRAALALAPDNARIHNKLGVVLRDLDRPDEALACFETATRITPSFAIALSNLGVTLRSLRRFEEAVRVLRSVAELIPDDSGAHVNLGNALGDLSLLGEAEASCRRALALAPEDREAVYNLGSVLLCQGRLAEAWPLFEARWQVGGHQPREFGKPRWSPASGPARVLLHAEQGLGDTLQFCRFAPWAAARAAPGGTVFVEVQAPLRRLIAEQGWPVTVLQRGDALPDFDEQCALMSLPGAFGVTLDDLPGAIPYLRADRARTEVWAARLAALPGVRAGLRVGVVWAGNPAYPADRNRSLPRALLAPLAGVPGVSLVSLQVGATGEDAAPELHDWTGELADFADTAALIAALDLVISVDTAVAHLAGALGKPVWLLNRFDACWRWMRGGEDSAWYPTMRQFRQTAPGDWPGVIGRVADALAAEPR